MTKSIYSNLHLSVSTQGSAYRNVYFPSALVSLWKLRRVNVSYYFIIVIVTVTGECFSYEETEVRLSGLFRIRKKE